MNNWFESKNLKVLAYQTDTINKVKDSLSSQEITVLAACPSAGKTIMAIHCIEDFLQKNPNSKVIVLAHGTTVLRTQFHDVLEEIKPDFTYKLADNFSEYDETKAVNVCLPQTLNRKSLTKIDLLVVDEAHQFYFGEKMVKDIIKKTKPRRQLLLTGTPSIFIREKHPIIPVTLNTIFDEGMVSDVYVEIATSSYNFDIYDYNTNDELKSEVHFKDSETKKTLDDLIAKIVERLKSIRGNEYVNLLPEWLPTLKRLQKTMIACKSQRQAIQVKNYFDKIGVKSALSISDIDYDSVEIENFKADPACLILIVVGRGILGFNYPELVNVVDMTTSMNVDRVYQLFCRVVRKHPNGLQKLFFKIAPNTLSDYYKYVMTGVLALSDEYYFTHFNGKNFNDMQIPVRPHVNNNGGGNNTNDNTTTIPNRKKPVKRLSPIDFSALPVFELFKDIYHKKDSLLHTYAFTTIREVRAEFMNRNYWSKENCILDALNYSTKTDWKANNGGAYNSADYNGWMEECTNHMIKRGFLTKEMCIESALKYNTINEWRKYHASDYTAAIRKNWIDDCTKHMIASTRVKGFWKIKENCINVAKKCTLKSEFIKKYYTAYDNAKKNGWLEECYEHMNDVRHKWTIVECISNASKYDTAAEWKKNNPAAYGYAYSHGWLKECVKNMKLIQYPHGYWTKEKCIESALNYEKNNDWKFGDPKAYDAAQRLKCIKECTAHITKFHWTKELCIETAKKYEKIKDWYNNEKSAYSTAVKRGWLNECTAHMTKLNSWTKEKCIESAKLYNSSTEWQKNNSKAYGAASYYGWLVECTAHMKKK
jgi:superfamily II DNA or RNA helicase